MSTTLEFGYPGVFNIAGTATEHFLDHNAVKSHDSLGTPKVGERRYADLAGPLTADC